MFIMFPQIKIFEKYKAIFNSVVVDVGVYGISWKDEFDIE